MLKSMDLSKLEVLPEQPDSYYYLVPQDAITHTLMKDCRQNAIWDMNISPSGRVYFSLCAELSEALHARLYEYLPATREFKECFKLEEKILQKDNAIRASKIHSSISFMNDGRIIMSTHTTSRAPQHPYWMVDGYYNHIWEGFQGSNILIYDPETGAVDNRGVPVPRETIYGGTYCKKNNSFYFAGMIKGHMYRLQIDTNELTDYGQTTEFGSFRFIEGVDGNIYTSTRSGRIYRINTTTDKVEYYQCRLPENDIPASKMNTQIGFATNGPDGKIYIAGVFAKSLYVFDPISGLLEDRGDFKPEGVLNPYAYKMDGIVFDNSNNLWFTIVLMDEIWQSRGVKLVKWDIFNGKKPIDIGFVGTPGRSMYCASEMHCHDDIIFISDSNHMFDPPGIIEIDISKITESGLTDNRIKSDDPALYICVENGGKAYPADDYEDQKSILMGYMSKINEHYSFLQKNPFDFQSKKLEVVRLWQILEPEYSKVKHLEYVGKDELIGYCGNDDKTYRFEIKGSTISEIEQYSGEIPSQMKVKVKSDIKLPSTPGRQYLAIPSASVKYKNDSIVVGSKDGFLAKITGDKVFSIGLAYTQGPVRSLCFSKQTGTVFGVAGHDEDLGNIFSYDDDNGIQWLGRCYVNSPVEPGLSMSNILTCMDINFNGTQIAIGSGDGLGCIYIYDI